MPGLSLSGFCGSISFTSSIFIFFSFYSHKKNPTYVRMQDFDYKTDNSSRIRSKVIISSSVSEEIFSVRDNMSANTLCKCSTS